MECSSSASSASRDESDEPQTPHRSPSRLDFCMEGLEGDDSPTHRMDWSCASFRDDFPYTFVEDTVAIYVAPPTPSRLLVVESLDDDSPQATDSCVHKSTDTSHTFFAPPDLMDRVIVEPQAPIPVHPSSARIQAYTQESMPPSHAAPQRLNYPHHGFSRSALLQQKTLWNSRHEEWAEWQIHSEQDETRKQGFNTNDAYTGIATPQSRIPVNPPPYMRTPPSGLERDVADHRKHEQDVHASIYPRVGDISALRDPYSVNIDRSFFRLPLWTLHKTLYAFDMQQSPVSVPPSAPPYNVRVSMSSSTSSSYSSLTSGDDDESDSTLVADDSPLPKKHGPLESLMDAPSLHGLHPWKHPYGWELSWYARWELLISIFQRDGIRHGAFDIPTTLPSHLEPRTASSLAPRQILRLIVGEGNGDDEDEDYGTLVADSSFSADFDEECERALAFYSREMKYPDSVTM